MKYETMEGCDVSIIVPDSPSDSVYIQIDKKVKGVHFHYREKLPPNVAVGLRDWLVYLTILER